VVGADDGEVARDGDGAAEAVEGLGVCRDEFFKLGWEALGLGIGCEDCQGCDGLVFLIELDVDGMVSSSVGEVDKDSEIQRSKLRTNRGGLVWRSGG